MTENEQVSGEIVEDISGGASFAGSPPIKDPMQRADEVPPEGVPAKFWDADKGAVKLDDLLKSYSELEKKFSAPKEDEQQQSTDEQKSDDQSADDEQQDQDQQQSDDEQQPGDDQSDDEQKPDDQQDEDQSDAEVSLQDAITTAQSYFQEHGDLPADARKGLHALGITDEVIDLQISGARAFTAALQKTAIEAAQVSDYAEVEKAIQWAADNWSAKKIAAFNAQAGDLETIGGAVSTLFKDFRSANPGEGRMVNVNSSVSRGEVYTSRAEFQQELNAADKARDPVARQKAIAKMDRSLKSGSIKK